ncbi:MBL fold metallo-hydrolase [Glycomyces buryatensis]|uniref:MBL fold metallo-hydrolase n=2 Tax=Glycomyces buryatensis TaxID=2570927 RepID=A0A4S8Q9T7_9ACTN|nr:MBL fold metallo-hydrolase [Glycomyces buryatensis]
MGDAASADPAVETTGDHPPVTIRWLGTNAWEIKSGDATVLVDPWVSRFYTGATKDEPFEDALITVDETAVDEHIGDAADCILITHGHWDHITDTPYVAQRTGATVLGTETHLNLLRAMDAPEEQMGQVSGGEYYQFDGFTVEVFEAHHNVSAAKTLLFPGTRPSEVPPRPEKVSDLVEGGSLAYLIRFGDFSLLAGITTNFQERELDSLNPTVLFMQASGRPSGPDYERRLLEAAGRPKYVVPTHWDDYEEPLTEPAIDWLGVHDLGDRVAEISPESEFVFLDHLEQREF